MSRISRKSFDSCFFHVICQGFEKKYIFDDQKFKEKYFNLLKEFNEDYNIKILAYCIMDNHVHILLYCECIDNMSNFMKKVNSNFALYYNLLNERVGYVFRDRFLSEPIISKNQLLSCVSYIHYNPVLAGIVNELDKYHYSSYNDFLNKSNFVNDDVLTLLFDSAKDYFELFSFIHSNEGYGIDIKKDNRRLTYINSKNLIEKIMMDFDFCNFKESSENIKRYFLKLFIREGITIYSIEKYFKIDHKYIKKLIRH